MKRWISIFLTVALAAPSFAVTGRVAGKVVNKTTGQGQAGVEVSLVKPGEKSDSRISSTVSGPGGAFLFAKVVASDEDIFMTQANFQGYRYETVAFDGTGRLGEMGLKFDPNNIELAVFNSTRTAPPLVFQAHHMALEQSEKVLKVTERIVVTNSSNQNYIGDEQGATVRLSLPAGAKEVALDAKTDGKLVKTSAGYAVAKAITPAAYQRRNAIIVTYSLDWPTGAPWNRSLDLSHQVFYPTSFYFVARRPEDKELKLDAPQLGAEKTENITPPGGKEPIIKVVNSIGEPMSETPALKAGDSVSVKVSRPMNSLVWAFFIFVGALIAMVPLALRGGRLGPVPGRGESTKIKATFGGGGVSTASSSASPGLGNELATSPPAQKLILEIARLDEEFAAGDVAENSYRKKRAALKKQLMEMLS